MSILIGTDTLNPLFQAELTALESYEYAQDSIDEEPIRAQLRELADDHRDAAGLLRQYILRCGGNPDGSSHYWGPWAQTALEVVGQEREAICQALKEGEEQAIQAYEEALFDDIHPDAKATIRFALLPWHRQHVRILENLRTSPRQMSIID